MTSTITSTEPPAPLPEAPAGGPRPSTGRGGRLRALDGLRLVAALMVCLYHYAGRGGRVSTSWGDSPRHLFPSLAPAASYGSLGVELFFVISGFVICMSGWGRTPLAFAASRASRLMPAYWAAVVLLFAVALLPATGLHRIPPSDALVNMTMLQQPLGAQRELGVCWTLWVELRFYLLFALTVVWRGASRRNVTLLCVLWTAAAVLADGADHPLLDEVLVPQYAPFFVGGMALYLVHRFGHSAVAWSIVAVSWLLGQHYAVRETVAPASVQVFHHRSPLVVIAVVTLSFAVVAAAALGRLDRLRWGWLTVAGALTYPFYLVHEHLGWAAIRLLRGHGVPPPATLALTVTGMLLLAWLLHRVVERPLSPRLKQALLARSIPTSVLAARSSPPRSRRG